MTPPEAVDSLAVPRPLLDDVRYADVVVTFGSPDNPDVLAIGVHRREGLDFCLLNIAEGLRDVADRIEAEHGDGPCGASGER